MKHKLKKILLLYLLSGMLFVSCSLEDEYLKQNNSNHKIKIERKTFHELMKEEKFNAAYTKISKQKNPISSSVLGRTVMEVEYDFTISNIPAKVITYGNNISYNFHINRNVSNSNYFENLVVKIDSTNVPKAYIIKYVLNSNPIFISEHNAYTLDAQTEITQINYNDTEAKIEYYDGCAVVTLWCPYDGPHPAGPECLNQRFDDLYWVRDTSGCGDGLDSGGGGSSGPVDTTGGGGGTGGTGDLDTPHNDSGNNNPIVTAPVLELEEENETPVVQIPPCEKLKNLFSNTSLKVKSRIINDLRPNIDQNPDGEKAVFLKKEVTGRTGSIVSEPTIKHQVEIKAGGNYFAAIHTHPFKAIPMFSWSDVLVLKTLSDNLQPYNNDMASFLLVCKDRNGVYQTYAIVYNNSGINTLDIVFGLSMNEGMQHAEIAKEMDKKLEKEYTIAENNGTFDYAKVFLSQFSGSNISLYKANSNLDNWSKVEINPLNQTSYEVPCEE